MNRDKKRTTITGRTKITCPDCNRQITDYMIPMHRRAAHPISTPMPKAPKRRKPSTPPPVSPINYDDNGDPVSDAPTMFPTGATRTKLNIGRVDLIVPEMIYGLGRRLELGAETHGERNWELGITYSELIRHTQHHLSELANCHLDSIINLVNLNQRNISGNDTVYGHACGVLCNAAFIVAFLANGNPAERK